ncbi:MAG: VWA domain-containing protein [bacterium]|nr:VWA domain-containing protein [bacterium]
MEDKSGFIIAGAVGVLVLSLGVWSFNSFLRPSSPQVAHQTAGGQVGAPVAENAITISIASSNTKEAWLAERVESFNQGSLNDQKLQSGGKPIYVKVLKETIDGKQKDYRSGTMVSDTVNKKIQPTILSPGEETWLEKFRKDWKAVNSGNAVTGSSPVLLRTPLVVAMWQSRAKAIGAWPTPGQSSTWKSLRSLASTSGGWKTAGHPAWGAAKLGYGYFGESNSGTLAVVSMCMSGAQKVKGLTAADVSKTSGCGQCIAAFESAKVHSGKSDLWLLEQMKDGGPEYMDMVATYESNVISFNKKYAAELREPLVSVYPQDGTVIVGHPYAILDAAPWTTPEQTEAAKVFQVYLLSSESQAKGLEFGLRPADQTVKLSAPIDPSNGANPSAKLIALSVPSADVVDRIGEVWHSTKKHSVIALVFDKSGSMGDGNKITAAVKGAQEFVNRMDRDDELLWAPFDDKMYPIKRGLKSAIGEQLLDEIGGTVADGGTSLYDAISVAHTQLQAIRSQYGTSRRYGIVVLSDGMDQNSGKRLSDIEALLKPSEKDPNGIQVHVVAIGSDADEKVLKMISSSGHGIYRKGESVTDMEKYYKEIAAYF